MHDPPMQWTEPADALAGRSTETVVIRPEPTTSDERQTLDYANPPRTSGVAEGVRLVGAAVCVFTALAGIGIVGFGLTAFFELSDAPQVDRPYILFVGSVICLIGLIVVGFSIRWFINAIRPNRRVTIDAGPAGK